jgi:hypothetical protein
MNVVSQMAEEGSSDHEMIDFLLLEAMEQCC